MADSASNSPESVIRVDGLSKSYGKTVALDNVGFSVRRGEIFGYLGPNGAGKTTTINILCGLIGRDTGEVRICGGDIDLDPVAIKRQIGVVPEESNLYPELTCRRNLEYLGELYGLTRVSKRTKAAELLEEFDLADKAEAPFRALSRGMKRRLTVAAAFVHSPPVVFLDEPTAGLDVPSARALRDLIRTMNRNGATVFLTTHNLAEAESLCDRILILVKGRVVAEGTAAAIRQRVTEAHTISLVLSADIAAESFRKACPAVKTAVLAEGRWVLDVSDVHVATIQVAAFAEESGIRVLEIASGGTSLEDAFMTILDTSAVEPEVG
jgi:ABC-2 type transport system ATP-binding protein